MPSLFMRLYLSIVGVLILCTGITFFAIDYYLQEDQHADFARDISEVSYYLQEVYTDTQNWQQTLKHIPRELKLEFDIQRLDKKQLENIGEKHTYLTTINGIDVYQMDEHRLSAVTKISEELTVSISDSDLLLHEEYFEQQEDVEEDAILGGGAFIGALLVFFSIALVLYIPTYNIVRHVQRLISTSHQLAQGDFSARVDTSMPQPLNELAHSFNSMAVQIQQSSQDQKVMANAVAHELRTPLSRFRLALGLLETFKLPDNAKELLGDLDSYTTELQQLTDEILRLATLTNESTFSPLENINISRLTGNRIETFQALNKQIEINFYAPENTFLQTEPRTIQLALDNLIKNACKFSRSQVNVQIHKSDKKINISVEDDGPGICVEDREIALKEFTRLDESRTRDTGGFGLGLAIVNVAIKRLGGELMIADSNLGGAAFEITLPNEV